MAGITVGQRGGIDSLLTGPVCLTDILLSGVREVLRTSGWVSVGITVSSTDRDELVMGSGCTGSSGACMSTSCGARHVSTTWQYSDWVLSVGITGALTDQAEFAMNSSHVDLFETSVSISTEISYNI